MFVADIQNS